MRYLRPLVIIGSLGVATALLLAQSAHVDSASTSTGSVAGHVTAATGQLPEMIVFLEPVDPGVTFPPPQRVEVISQKGAKFSPSLLVIARGQTVEFHNDEDRPIEHNVFSRSPTMPFDLGLYPPPQVKRVTFDQPGPVQLYCSIHRYMDGVIYVCPTPFFAKVQPDGSFAIENIPAGSWRIRTWQRSPRFNDAEQAVRVEAGRQIVVNLEMRRG